MRIAILSDIHDNIWVLKDLLAGLQADALLFCGDFCAPFTLAQIAEGFGGPVHVVFGNNDGDKLLLSRVASRFSHVTLHGDLAELDLDGRRVAVSHYPQDRPRPGPERSLRPGVLWPQPREHRRAGGLDGASQPRRGHGPLGPLNLRRL